MPAPPRWLLAVPDAVRQLEKLDRDLVTRRARAAQLMRTFGAELAGSSRVLRRADLLRQLKEDAGGGPRVPRRPPAPDGPGSVSLDNRLLIWSRWGAPKIFPTG